MEKKRKPRTKKCPFCGASSELYETCIGQFMVFCRKCKSTTAYYATDKEAVDAWNRRSV